MCYVCLCVYVCVRARPRVCMCACARSPLHSGAYFDPMVETEDKEGHVITAVTPIVGFEDVPLPVPGVYITDVDLEDGSIGYVTVTLQAQHGTLSMSWHTNTTSSSPNERNSLDNDLTGLTFLVGTALGAGSSYVQWMSTMEIANAALATLKYTTVTDYYGDDALTVSVSDNGFTGLGGAKFCSATIPIQIWPVNDAPELHVFRLPDGTNLVRMCLWMCDCACVCV